MEKKDRNISEKTSKEQKPFNHYAIDSTVWLQYNKPILDGIIGSFNDDLNENDVDSIIDSIESSSVYNFLKNLWLQQYGDMKNIGPMNITDLMLAMEGGGCWFPPVVYTWTSASAGCDNNSWQVVKNSDGSTTTTITHSDGSRTSTTEGSDGSVTVVNYNSDGEMTGGSKTFNNDDGSSTVVYFDDNGDIYDYNSYDSEGNEVDSEHNDALSDSGGDEDGWDYPISSEDIDCMPIHGVPDWDCTDLLSDENNSESDNDYHSDGNSYDGINWSVNNPIDGNHIGGTLNIPPGTYVNVKIPNANSLDPDISLEILIQENDGNDGSKGITIKIVKKLDGTLVREQITKVNDNGFIQNTRVTFSTAGTLANNGTITIPPDWMGEEEDTQDCNDFEKGGFSCYFGDNSKPPHYGEIPNDDEHTPGSVNPIKNPLPFEDIKNGPIADIFPWTNLTFDTEFCYPAGEVAKVFGFDYKGYILVGNDGNGNATTAIPTCEQLMPYDPSTYNIDVPTNWSITLNSFGEVIDDPMSEWFEKIGESEEPKVVPVKQTPGKVKDPTDKNKNHKKDDDDIFHDPNPDGEPGPSNNP